VEAVNNAADARDMFKKAGMPCDDAETLLSKLVPMAKQQGISLERQGKFHEAIAHYKAALPFADADSQRAMTHEVNLLRRLIREGKCPNR
jgi:hypothetical protein